MFEESYSSLDFVATLVSNKMGEPVYFVTSPAMDMLAIACIAGDRHHDYTR